MSEYDGAVHPGGPAQTRVLPELSITKISVGPMDNNAYLLRCRKTGAGALIDAANDAARLIDLVGTNPVSTIITTHQHADHWQALPELAEHTGARIVAHPADAPGLPITVTDLTPGGEVIGFGAIELEAIHLVGHTPGSLALLYQDPHGTPHLFTGDCLFPGGPGRTTTPEEFTSLMDGLEQRIFARLPDATWVYPGHGKDTTLGAERAAIPEWRARGW